MVLLEKRKKMKYNNKAKTSNPERCISMARVHTYVHAQTYVSAGYSSHGMPSRDLPTQNKKLFVVPFKPATVLLALKTWVKAMKPYYFHVSCMIVLNI